MKGKKLHRSSSERMSKAFYLSRIPNNYIQLVLFRAESTMVFSWLLPEATK